MSEDDRNGKRPEPEVAATFVVRKQAKDKAHDELRKMGVPRVPRMGTRSRGSHRGGILN